MKKMLMLGLHEVKRVAEILSNDTARKVLNYLSEQDKATESQLATSLGLPLPTVHYNLQKLLRAGLVEANAFHYSKRGREVLHYAASNKYIVISPQRPSFLKQELKAILPAFGIIGIISIVVNLFSSQNRAHSYGVEKTAMLGAGPDVATASMAADPFSFSLLFLLGGVVALVIVMAIRFFLRTTQKVDCDSD